MVTGQKVVSARQDPGLFSNITKPSGSQPFSVQGPLLGTLRTEPNTSETLFLLQYSLSLFLKNPVSWSHAVHVLSRGGGAVYMVSSLETVAQLLCPFKKKQAPSTISSLFLMTGGSHVDSPSVSCLPVFHLLLVCYLSLYSRFSIKCKQFKCNAVPLKSGPVSNLPVALHIL